MDYRKFVFLVVFSPLLLLSCQEDGSSSAENSAAETSLENRDNLEENSPMEASQENVPEHSDHDSQHGGIFFMALDEMHHLEGTLTPPGIFRVYLYDARTQLLAAERVNEAQGTVHWGEFPDPPAIPLKIVEDEGMLEAELNQAIDFPVTLTLLLHFPGNDPRGKPELFNFIFHGFSEPPDS